MPRNYVKRNLRAQWSLENLQAAIADIRDKKASIREISRTYKILAYKFVIKNGITNRFNHVKQHAGYDWIIGFLKRHPEITIRKAQRLSIARMKGMNKEEVDDYFDLLGNIFDEHGFYNCPRKIYNVDETGVQLNNPPDKVPPDKVLASKGAKAVCSLTSAEKGETITVLTCVTCVNAEGHFLPPYCIFKGKNKKPEFEDGLPPGGQVIMGEKSAYVTSAIFLKWLQNVFVPRKDPGKVLLILDGHSSHVSDPDVLDYAASKDAFLKPLKTYWRDACSSWMRNNVGRKLTRYQFPTLINSAWSKAATVQNGVSGFKACGIYPLDKSIIPDYAFRYDENKSTSASADPGIPVAAAASPTLTATAPASPEVITSIPELTIAPGDQDITTESLLLTAPIVLKNITAIPSTSFYNIQRIPTISCPSGSASHRKQHAQILTSPDVIAAKRTNKEKLKAAAEKRAQNATKKKSQGTKIKTNPKPTVMKKKKNQKVRKRKESSSSSASSVEMDLHSTDDDQDIIDEIDDCKKRWKRIRDSYLKIKKSQKTTSGQAAIKRPKWSLFEFLSFLYSVPIELRSVNTLQPVEEDSIGTDTGRRQRLLTAPAKTYV
ncbi:DDE superfamily endonuclease [Popillia japonica]|uniref:DDE superfamily endonuclease n=1 Tax=Popillia japonica TaxID=7064 RepID=A0AAW1I7Z9_POPJA